MTNDNGREFDDHARIYAERDSTGYFSDPFDSWQRGSNKNLNGFLLQ